MDISITALIDGIVSARKTVDAYVDAWKKPRHRYSWHYLNSPVRENTILFESFHGKNISDSPLYMMRDFLADPQSSNFKVYCSTNKNDYTKHRAFLRELGLQVDLVPVDTMRYAYVLATAKYLVNNSSFPAYFIRRPEQRYIQTWHGTPLKTLGKQMRLGIESMYNVQHNFLQASIITFPNNFTRNAIMRDYNLENLYTGSVAMIGYPRNQVFFDERKRTKLRRTYNLESYENIAYMPTWRGSNNYTVNIENYRKATEEQLVLLDKALRDNQRLYVNFHSMVANQIKLGQYKHILPFPTNVDNYEFLNAMDALVTDYSSVFFDFAITRKPIILFAYDLEEYLTQRGMYLDINSLPFPIVTTADDLAVLLSTGAYKDMGYAGTIFERDFLCYDAPNNARKALELLFDEESSNGHLISYASNGQRKWNVLYPTQQSEVNDIETICRAADPEHDLVVFNKSAFNEDKSLLLYDKYRDAFNYSFATKAYVCTVSEELRRLSNPAIAQEIARRDQDRIFPNLSIDNVTRTLFLGDVGSNLICPNAMLEKASAKVSSQKGKLHIKLKNNSDKYSHLVLIQGRKIIWKRPLNVDECANGKIRESFRSINVESLIKDNSNLKVFLERTDENGRHSAVAISPTGLSTTYNDDKLSNVLAPLFAQTTARHPEVQLTPYTDSNGILNIAVSLPENSLIRFKFAMLEHLRRHGDLLSITVKMRDTDFLLESMALKLRDDTDNFEIPIPFSAHARNGWIEVTATFNPSTLPLREIYWDAFLVVSRHGLRSRIPIKYSTAHLWYAHIGNQQWRIGDNKVFFPHVRKGNYLSFMFRDYYPKLDTYAFRMKELAAFATFAILHPYWKHKRIWLVYEKFCELAQDNAYHFFEYCMNLPENQRKHVYYVIDKHKPDYAKLVPYDAQVLDFTSFKHILYTMVAKLYIASDSRTHLYVWRSKPSIIRRRISKHKIFFLQHGVTALKQVAHLFGKKGSSPMTYFLTTSENEQRIVVNNLGYSSNRAPILGFSRWDVLEDRSDTQKPQILLMPTWRPWLEEQSDEVFVSSDYFKAYSSLLESQRLSEVLERHNAKIRFFIHPKLSSMLGHFETTSNRIELVPMGSEPLNEVMMEASMAITDYSSICWDMLYMNKPVVFYQFDRMRYQEVIGSYLDLEQDLPGIGCLDEESLVTAIDEIAKRDFTLTSDEKKMSDCWFAYRDKRNRERTYSFISDRGF